MRKRKDKKVFDQYPIYLKNTLMYTGDEIKKFRNTAEVVNKILCVDNYRLDGNNSFRRRKY